MSAHSPADVGAPAGGEHLAGHPDTSRAGRPQQTIRRRWRTRRTLSQIALQIPFVLMALTVLFPLYFMIANSLKTRSAFAQSALNVPNHPTLSKYSDAINSANLGRFFVNSAIISVVSVAVATACAALAAYAFAKMTFPGSEAIFRIMLPTMAIPSIVLLVPQFKFMTRLDLINSRWSVIILYIGIMLPMSLYLFRNFFRTFPNDLLDAAAIDGLGSLRTLLRIVLPASRPVIFTAVIINFVFAWNELILALVFLQNEQQRTLMVGVTVFSGLYSLDVPELMAGMTIATVPVVLVYLIGQRHLMRGLLGGMGK
ncbi:MAG TPA: carbohydrate ABC transporter permease [Jatrophihabitans sp.]|jgi:ABC-type glycerol-3-phosphate transport system permease component|nr:carbohydrate ABC transporter permease [Jatrophihabitans sp.]